MSTALATTTQANGQHRPAAKMMSFHEIQELAETVAKSRLFPGIESPQAACALMMVCQAEGLHPMQAMRRFHIIEGRISMRADAMQAEFQARGGHVKEIESNDDRCELVFSHPVHCPEGRTIKRTRKQFIDNGVAMGREGIKKNWKNYPEAMLWARCISAGVRKVDPGTIAGVYTPEEVMDFDPAELQAIDTTEDVGEGPQQPPGETILPALPPVIDNASGYGRGQYASPQETAEYKAACREFVEGRNGRWLDYWTEHDGAPIEGVKDLITTIQMTRHLLKWGLRTERLAPVGLRFATDTGKPVEKVSVEQAIQYVAILHGRDREALWVEAETYCDELAEMEMAKRSAAEEGRREPGSDDA